MSFEYVGDSIPWSFLRLGLLYWFLILCLRQSLLARVLWILFRGQCGLIHCLKCSRRRLNYGQIWTVDCLWLCLGRRIHSCLNCCLLDDLSHLYDLAFWSPIWKHSNSDTAAMSPLSSWSLVWYLQLLAVPSVTPLVLAKWNPEFD